LGKFYNEKRRLVEGGIILLTVKTFAVAVIDDDLLCLGLTPGMVFNRDHWRGAR
jgi:hypothetical protein